MEQGERKIAVAERAALDDGKIGNLFHSAKIAKKDEMRGGWWKNGKKNVYLQKKQGCDEHNKVTSCKSRRTASRQEMKEAWR